jgi:hypothetical protein
MAFFIFFSVVYTDACNLKFEYSINPPLFTYFCYRHYSKKKDKAKFRNIFFCVRLILVPTYFVPNKKFVRITEYIKNKPIHEEASASFHLTNNGE